jgi:hypothetical protein
MSGALVGAAGPAVFNLGALKVIDDICVSDKKANRKKILDFELIAKTFPQIEIPVTHRIHGGMYAREITIPKDTILTGHIYKFDHFDVMISGDITVSTDTGERKRFTGYNCFKGMSGKKRAGYAHEDTIWITFHPFTGDNGNDIQKFITAESFEELEFFNCEINKADYKSMISEMDINEDEMDEQVKNTNDMTELPDDYSHIYLDNSSIDKQGLFSELKILSGDIICPSRIKDKRTIAGRYTNHALQPNAEMIFDGENINLVSNRDIEANEEITVNYRYVLKTRNLEGDLSCQE